MKRKRKEIELLEQNETGALILQLPTEVILSIFAWLHPIEICKLVKPVCKDWLRICGQQDSLWGGWLRFYMPFFREERKPNQEQGPIEWPCEVCTFLNSDLLSSICEVCAAQMSSHVAEMIEQEKLSRQALNKSTFKPHVRLATRQLTAVVQHSPAVRPDFNVMIASKFLTMLLEEKGIGTKCLFDSLLMHEKRGIRIHFSSLLGKTLWVVEKAREALKNQTNKEQDDPKESDRLAHTVWCEGRKMITHLISLVSTQPEQATLFRGLISILVNYVSIGPLQCKRMISKGYLLSLLNFLEGTDFRKDYINSPAIRIARESRHFSAKESLQLRKKADALIEDELGALPTVIANVVKRCMIDETRCKARELMPPTFTNGPILSLGSCAEKILTFSWLTKALYWSLDTQSIAETVMHCCWENEGCTKTVITVLYDYLDSNDYEAFPPAFYLITALLTQLTDSLAQLRIITFLESFMQLLKNNEKYKLATTHSIDFLASLSCKHAGVKEWVEKHEEDWITYFTDHFSAEVNLVTAQLIRSLNEGKFVKPEEFETTPKEPTCPKEKMIALYSRFIEYLPKQMSRTTATQQFEKRRSEAAPYLSFMRWLLCVEENREDFWQNHRDELTQLYKWLASQTQHEDESVFEVLVLWNYLLEFHPEGIEEICNTKDLCVTLMGSFVALRNAEPSLKYNSKALPLLYGLILRCCQQSVEFLGQWLMHSNFAWALRFLFLSEWLPSESPMHQIFLEIIKLGSHNEPFKKLFLGLIIKGHKQQIERLNIIRALRAVLVGPQDLAMFFGNYPEGNGISVLNKLMHLNDVEDAAWKEEAAELLEYILSFDSLEEEARGHLSTLLASLT